MNLRAKPVASVSNCPISPSVHEQFVETLETLNAAIQRHDRYLLLAVDEIQDGTLDDLRVLVRFVHLTAGTNEPVLLIGTGLPNSPSHLHAVRTYTERWNYLRIRLLEPAETIEAIATHSAALGVTIEDAALECLVVESGGYPFFVQEHASAAWTAHRGATIGLADVESGAPGVRRLLEADFCDEQLSQPHVTCLYVLELSSLGLGSHPVGEVATRLASTSERLSSVCIQLVRKDVVFAPSPGLIEFQMPLTDLYVERPARR